MRSAKVVFVPKYDVIGITTERSPKMLEMLSDMYDVKAIEVGRVNRFVFDQKQNKLARYLLFPLDVAINFRKVLKAIEEGADLVFAEGSYFSFAAGIAAKLKRVPMIWDNHGHIVKFSQVQNKSISFMKANVAMERILIDLSTKVLVVNDRDRQDYISIGFDPLKLVVIPTCADMSLVRQRIKPRDEARILLGLDKEERIVLFIGTLNYEPNIDAVSYIASIMPRINAQEDNTKVYIAGSGTVSFTPPEGMIFLGFVPDLYLWLSAANVCIAPMWKGVGILTKVIDYLSATRATVVTPLALDGIPELKHQENCLLGLEKEDFYSQLIRALKDKDLQEKIALAGFQLIIDKYSCEVVSHSLSELVDSLTIKRTDPS